jgi:D-arabinonate dehydratase
MSAVRSVRGVKLAYGEHYERDALAVVGGAEHPMEVILVEVETTNGAVGYGEAICYGVAEGVLATVNRVLGRLVVGEDFHDVARLWDRMYRASFRVGRRGILVSALSGIDLALWDLLGKELGAPVYRLLGGSGRPIKGYITGGYYREGKGIPQLVEEVRGYLREGFDTVKIKIGGLGVGEDVKRLEALREEFGERLRMAVDANNVYDFPTALRMGRELERLGVLFFEEPVPTDHPRLSAELARSLDVPIAGYETAATLYEYRDLIAQGAVDIVQADAAWNGGITEMWRIGALARAYGLPVIPHYSAGGVGFVASLHTALAIGSPIIEFHLKPNPLRLGLAGDAIAYENGYFKPPPGPGLGVKPDPKVVEEYRA